MRGECHEGGFDRGRRDPSAINLPPQPSPLWQRAEPICEPVEPLGKACSRPRPREIASLPSVLSATPLRALSRPPIASLSLPRPRRRRRVDALTEKGEARVPRGVLAEQEGCFLHSPLLSEERDATRSGYRYPRSTPEGAREPAKSTAAIRGTCVSKTPSTLSSRATCRSGRIPSPGSFTRSSASLFLFLCSRLLAFPRAFPTGRFSISMLVPRAAFPSGSRRIEGFARSQA
jgi:hypothetical protein